MEEGAKALPWMKSVNLSLQIIITILTIIKLFINFHESEKYDGFLIIDTIFNFIILINVNIIPFLIDKVSNDEVVVIAMILACCWALNIFTGVYISYRLSSNDLLGIYNFTLYGRILLIFFL